ncbi:MAG TPA: cohesin domain-containing protein [Candidatus Acidoferrales bacterium]|jgi:general secretion pathway protein D|nr:cohesin domain-containing protein [Candidatus Acidoferrales bacterium]
MLFLTACPKGNQEYGDGKKAEAAQDYDTALVHYERALRAEPTNIEYKLRVARLRFQAGQFHVKQGQKAREKGDLTLALAEFQKAAAIDPSSSIATQEAQRTLDAIEAQRAAEAPHQVQASQPEEAGLMTAPPELKPLSREPINLKMVKDAKIVFETIGKLAGLSVIFDPDFTSRVITADLPNVTLEQALDAVALESKAFWKPVTPNIILVAPDQPQKRRDLDEEEVRTFYLSNTLTPQDLTEVVTGLRQLLDLKRIQQVNAQNAIIVRDTPDRLALASKIIRDIDKAKPEVVIHVQVLETRLDRMRDLGIQPGTSVSATFMPRTQLQPQSSNSTGTGTNGTGTTGTTNSTPQVTIQALRHLSSADYSLTLPGATATALLTDSSTRIIQDPEIRVTDGQEAKLRIGDRVPIATGSFQAGVGVGVGGTSGVINPLVNTQFTYQDVGVNIDVTPRVHPNGEVSMKLGVEVSSVTGEQPIGGITQPIISQRKIEHEIRLREGEVSILGGLIQRTETKSTNGWPGFASIPFFRYFFSDNTTEVQDQEVLIVLTPHIIRLPSITAENLRTISAGTDTNPRVTHQAAAPDAPSPSPAPAASGSGAPPPAGATTPSATPSPAPSNTPQLRFDPPTVTVKPGDTVTIGLAVDNAQDLFSIPLIFQYDPAVIQIEEVRNGGFLSGGTQEIAIVERVDKEHGQAVVSATRQPNTPGINGSGTLLGIIIRGIGPGTSSLQVVQVSARDSQQRAIQMVAGEATVKVQ